MQINFKVFPLIYCIGRLKRQAIYEGLLKITPSQPIQFSYNQEKLEITAEKDESHDGHYRIKIKNLELPKHLLIKRYPSWLGPRVTFLESLPFQDIVWNSYVTSSPVLWVSTWSK